MQWPIIFTKLVSRPVAQVLQVVFTFAQNKKMVKTTTNCIKNADNCTERYKCILKCVRVNFLGIILRFVYYVYLSSLSLLFIELARFFVMSNTFRMCCHISADQFHSIRYMRIVYTYTYI